MADRLELQSTLEEILGSEEVYFQPPESIKMAYPAIVYELADVNAKHANNLIYIRCTGFKITLMDRDPDSEFVSKILELPRCKFNTFFTSDNLNHFVFTIY